MIISRIRSGLGNQLFQYALGRRIAHLNNVVLKLDITSFESYELRTYRLNHFNILENIATKDEIDKIKKKSTLLERFKPQYKHSYVKELNRLKFDPNILTLTDNVYIEGSWQSENYFKDIESIIRKDFTLRKRLDSINEKMAQKIKTDESISIHVRRGDYISNPYINQLFGTCPIDYYMLAIEKMVAITSKPHFFVFSDDINWSKENLKIEYPITYVNINGPDKDYADLYLMSLCKHHIIANSSFSWWGAWLCSNKEKSIIAPRKWFNFCDGRNKIETGDRVPDSWIRL